MVHEETVVFTPTLLSQMVIETVWSEKMYVATCRRRLL